MSTLGRFLVGVQREKNFIVLFPKAMELFSASGETQLVKIYLYSHSLGYLHQLAGA